MGGKISHCGCEVLPEGKDIECIVIDRIEWREDEVVNGEKTPCFVAIFAQNPYTNLPMVLNMENKERLIKMAHISEYDLVTIKNLPVRLTAEPTRLKRLGLRISKLPPTIPKVEQPKPKIVLTQEDPAWNSCVEFVNAGNPIDRLLIRYDISEELQKLLLKPKENNGTEGV